MVIKFNDKYLEDLLLDQVKGKPKFDKHIDLKLHPGEVLADELAARKITKSAFAIKIGMYPSQLSDILKLKEMLQPMLR